MTIESTNTVDFLAVEPGTGHIILTALDTLDWSSETEHLQLLQDKLNTYLLFMESGEVYEEVYRLIGARVAALTPIKVHVLAKHEASPKAKRFLDYVSRVFGDAGFAFEHRVVTPGTQEGGEPTWS
jgi:hypothetical protein